MDLKLYNINGSETGEVVSVSDSVFADEVSHGCIYYAVNNELANRRVGTACTKTRAEVNYSNVKPFRQKGTGNARQGDKKSPLRVGGGVIFGPKPRDYSYSLPKKMKRKAYRSLLSLAVQEDRLRIVEDFTTSGKTKDAKRIADAFSSFPDRTVFILKDDDCMVRRSARNIPNVRVLAYDKLSAKELLYGKRILVMKTAALNLSGFYGSKEVEG